MKHDTFNIGKKEHYLQRVQSYIHNLTISQLKAVVRLSNKPICLLVVIRCSTSLVGVMEAYFFYMEMAVVRFYYEVQIVLLAQLVRAARS